MAARHIILAAALSLAVLASGCTSRDERATTAAAIATDALQQGDLAAARVQIARALAARDDVSDYWLLSGRIALAEANYTAAYDAFESALALDRGNVEALTRLCQLAASSPQPQRAERYATQLASLHPGEKAALDVEAAIALDRGDRVTAMRLMDQVLVADPNDASALITRSRLLAADDDYPAAARAGEASLAAPGDPISRLKLLAQIYLKQGDSTDYRRTIARLARAAPLSTPTQIYYAQTLYDAGDQTGGFAVAQQILRRHTGDVAVAEALLNLWRAQGAAAMPITSIVAGAVNAPPETRATFAAYANAVSRPDLAMQALGTTGAADPPGTGLNDAKVARAEAQMLLHRPAEAAAGVAAVLGSDADQPRALAVRGALRAEAGDRRGAVEDLRRALIASPDNANARLALADLLLATGDGVLAARTLADGLVARASGGINASANDASGDLRRRPDPRLATRLSQVLRVQGRTTEAAAAIESYARDNPFAPRPAS